MTSRVTRCQVIKRGAVSTGQLRRRPEAGQRASAEVSPSASAEAEGSAQPEQGLAVPSADSGGGQAFAQPGQAPVPPPDQARIEVVSSGPETTEIHVHCTCGRRTVIDCSHPAEGGAS